MQRIVAEDRQDKDGRKTSHIRLVQWQLQAEWRETGIYFAKTFGQRHPEEDAIRTSLSSSIDVSLFMRWQ